MVTADASSEVVSKSAQLAAAFRERGFPVVLVNVDDSAPGRTDAGPRNYSFPDGWTDLVPELNAQAGDLLITKRSPGAFIGTSLHDELRRRDVTQVFITGVATSAGVEATARSAYDYGYNVVLVTDAMTDRDGANHSHSIEKIFPRLGETTSTADLLNFLR